MQRKFSDLRNTAYAEGVKSAGDVLADQDVRDFVVLYLAEGYRRARNSVAIANQNPELMKVCHAVMARFSNQDRFEYIVHYYPDQRTAALQRFWGAALGIAPDKVKTMRKTNAANLATKSWRSPNGILHIRVGDTYFRAKLQAWMGAVETGWSTK